MNVCNVNKEPASNAYLNGIWTNSAYVYLLVVT